MKFKRFIVKLSYRLIKQTDQGKKIKVTELCKLNDERDLVCLQGSVSLFRHHRYIYR